MQQWRSESGAMTFDEVSMERSKTFVKALQELKNLRPQLYSAAEYCEKSYLHSEQKQMVLDNLKNYAVRALVNAIDHLGTVAYKLTDLFEQQMLDISTIEMKISSLNQRTFTCQAYVDKEVLNQLQMSARTSRHHKHYILPDSVSNDVQNKSHIPADGNVNPIQAKSHSHAPGKSISKTLSWHLASEANSASNGSPLTAPCTQDAKTPKVNSEVFHLLVAEEPTPSLPLSSHPRPSSGNVTFDMISNKFGSMDPLGASKPSTSKSFGSPSKLEIYRPPSRSKSMLSAFFTKNKTFKTRKVSVS
ncbi:hypothetical protein MUK42_01564 [Musa troglodytarum]|uniref:Protein ABIL1 n=1 Tax=Musa troglodytarum TaxID=320322 RepID=A0A9E7FC44_9LILI|nr:hypothetical protein MUK42_01564 [Musa troglodytarum]